jgi:hypothetical protein
MAFTLLEVDEDKAAWKDRLGFWQLLVLIRGNSDGVM